MHTKHNRQSRQHSQTMWGQQQQHVAVLVVCQSCQWLQCLRSPTPLSGQPLKVAATGHMCARAHTPHTPTCSSTHSDSASVASLTRHCSFAVLDLQPQWLKEVVEDSVHGRKVCQERKQQRPSNKHTPHQLSQAVGTAPARCNALCCQRQVRPFDVSVASPSRAH